MGAVRDLRTDAARGGDLAIIAEDFGKVPSGSKEDGNRSFPAPATTSAPDGRSRAEEVRRDRGGGGVRREATFLRAYTDVASIKEVNRTSQLILGAVGLGQVRGQATLDVDGEPP